MKSFNLPRGTAFKSLLAAAALALAQAAGAAPVHISAQATVNSSFSGSEQYMALGTAVAIELTLDVSGPGSGSPDFSAVSGEFRWNDGIDRVFSANAPGLLIIHSSGEVDLSFAGSGPTINNQTPWYLGLVINIGQNPFTSTEDWADLMLGATVTGFRLGATHASGTGYLGTVGTATGTITAVQDANGVPEPATLALVSLAGLAGLAARRPRAARQA